MSELVNHPGAGGGFFGQLNALWQRIPASVRLNLENNFLPENPMDRPVPGEEVLLEIKIAPYRDLLSHLVLDHLGLFGLGTLLLTIGSGIYAAVAAVSLWFVLLPAMLLLLLIGYALYGRIEYLQWRLVKTNARLVISIPQPGSWPLVDNIELNGMPRVVDTNWSKKPLWRLFQAFTGARDLYISLVGYSFKEGSAQVSGALVIPDVLPKDIAALKKLVFTAK
jgi:hypothetical protein